MIKAYSQRLTPPFSGLVQIAESERARALTMDGNTWEIHFRHATNGSGASGPHLHRHGYRRVAHVRQGDLSRISEEGTQDGREIDERILELTRFLTTAELPFPSADSYEYWLLDAKDESPLAMIFSCTEAEHMPAFPVRLEWTALPAAVMPIEATDAEKDCSSAPVNYRVERLVAERAGSKPRARWFRRRPTETDSFPGMLLRVGTASGPDTSHPLHDSRFDIDEAALSPASQLMACVLISHLKEQAIHEAAIA